MYKESITYKDYNGLERTEDFYFNLTATELTRLEANVPGGLQAWLQKIVDAKDGSAIMNTFEKIIHEAYGEKDPDGRRFVKKKDGAYLADAFMETPAYDQFFMSLVTDADKAATFINAIIPNKEQETKVTPVK